MSIVEAWPQQDNAARMVVLGAWGFKQYGCKLEPSPQLQVCQEHIAPPAGAATQHGMAQHSTAHAC